MGIVVALVMLVGLVVMVRKNTQAVTTKAVALLLLIGGFWNALWYGLRNLSDFWGLAGLVSGIVMVLAAVYLWLSLSGNQQKTAIKVLLVCALGACFALYFITLLQLNLGYEIIR